jgi:hypothetical protein
LPEGYEPFTEYKMKNGEVRKFNSLFIKFENEIPQFMTFNSEHQYRILYQHKKKNEVSHNDINGKCCYICFSRISKVQNKLAEAQATIAETQKQIAETENNLSKAILNLTEIIKTQQTQHREEETSDEEWTEPHEPEEDLTK